MSASYKPGQAVHFTVTITDSTLTPFDPDTMTLTLHQQAPGSGSVSTTTPVNDSTGAYHCDVVLPSNMVPGTWVARWTATGVAASSNGIVETIFTVLPLLF